MFTIVDEHDLLIFQGQNDFKTDFRRVYGDWKTKCEELSKFRRLQTSAYIKYKRSQNYG